MSLSYFQYLSNPYIQRKISTTGPNNSPTRANMIKTRKEKKRKGIFAGTEIPLPESQHKHPELPAKLSIKQK